jgi:hypothetical protein
MVNLLQGKDVGVDATYTVGQPADVDTVTDGSAVKDVECRDPHGVLRTHDDADTPSGGRMLAHEDALRDALRLAASALRAHGPEFALGGSYALWVYGAPEPVHDVDIVVVEADVEHAVATLADAGFEIIRTPEDWLFKATMNSALVDVLHRVNGVVVDSALIAAADVLDVLAIPMPVLPPTIVLTQKLKSLHEHHCDFEALLPAVRAVRERVDWSTVRSETKDNDFATAFLFLLDRLGINEMPPG